MSYLEAVDVDAVRATVKDVIDAMWATDPRERLFVRQGGLGRRVKTWPSR